MPRRRHERRDRFGHEGMARRLRLLGGPGLRGRRRVARLAGHHRRGRGGVDRRFEPGSVVPHHRRCARRGHLRKWPHRPARRTLHDRSRRQGRLHRRQTRQQERARRRTRTRVRGRLGRRHRCRARHHDHRARHRQPAACQGGYLRRLLGPLPERGRRDRRDRADPYRRRLRAVHRRPEGHSHRPAARPACRTFPVRWQHERPGAPTGRCYEWGDAPRGAAGGGSHHVRRAFGRQHFHE